MAKISLLPQLADPTGNESAAVLDGGVTKRVLLSGIARAALAAPLAAFDPTALSGGYTRRMRLAQWA